MGDKVDGVYFGSLVHKIEVGLDLADFVKVIGTRFINVLVGTKTSFVKLGEESRHKFASLIEFGILNKIEPTNIVSFLC